jgi:SNF2 family DNA or RNA helicase
LEKFQTDQSIRFLVCSEVFREGVNIVEASTIIHFNLLWNPAKIEQRTGRIDRIGQKSTSINVIYVVAKQTIEIDIYDRVKSRQKLYDDVVNNNFQSDRTTFLERNGNKEMLKILRKKY